jgi:hypothetical protein
MIRLETIRDRDHVILDIEELTYARGPGDNRGALLTVAIALEFDADGHLAGIEILDAVQRFGTGEPLRQVVLENFGSKS